MSMLRDFFEGFAKGAVKAAAYHAASQGRIEGLLSQLGWSVDERNGNLIVLHFNGQGGDVRRVVIAGGDSSVVTFSASSVAIISANNLKGEVLAYLLTRNLGDGGIGQWGLRIADNKVSFHLTYSALGDGLNAEALKWICESMIAEAADFDAKMRQLS